MYILALTADGERSLCPFLCGLTTWLGPSLLHGARAGAGLQDARYHHKSVESRYKLGGWEVCTNPKREYEHLYHW
jgi:hypothetical protein